MKLQRPARGVQNQIAAKQTVRRMLDHRQKADREVCRFTTWHRCLSSCPKLSKMAIWEDFTACPVAIRPAFHRAAAEATLGRLLLAAFRADEMASSRGETFHSSRGDRTNIHCGRTAWPSPDCVKNAEINVRFAGHVFAQNFGRRILHAASGNSETSTLHWNFYSRCF
jgi:hypothetical protein